MSGLGFWIRMVRRSVPGGWRVAYVVDGQCRAFLPLGAALSGKAALMCHSPARNLRCRVANNLVAGSVDGGRPPQDARIRHARAREPVLDGSDARLKHDGVCDRNRANRPTSLWLTVDQCLQAAGVRLDDPTRAAIPALDAVGRAAASEVSWQHAISETA